MGCFRNEYVIVACRDAGGSPTMVGYYVKVTQEEYDNGDHYDKAYELAEADGYEGNFIGYDNSEHGDIIAMAEYLTQSY